MSLPQLPCQAIAVYSWSGEQQTDLGMIEGDKIEIVDYGDGNWWYGKLRRNRMEGVFPKNYVKILERSDSKQSISAMGKVSKSPSFASDLLQHSSSYQQLPRSRSQQQLPHSRSQQFEHDSDGELENSRFSYQSSKRFSAKPAHYSTPDLSRLTSGNSSPIRDSSPYFSEEIEDDDDDYDEAAPPPPPPKSKSSRDNLNKRHSLFSNQSSLGNKSSPLSSAVGTPDFSLLKNSMARNGLDISGYSSYQQFYDSLMSTDTEKSVHFGHSNFSATSAGSFARHKYQQEADEREQKIREIQQLGGLQNFSEKDQAEILKKVFVDKKQSRHPKLLKKLFNKEPKVSLDDAIYGLSLNDSVSDLTKSVSLREISNIANTSAHFDLEEKDSRDEILSRITMSATEIAKREKRSIEENPYAILKPFDAVNENMNYNEIVSKPHVNIDSIPLYHVDKFIRSTPIDKFESIESIALNTIGAHFKSDLEKIKAIYCFCTEKIELIPVEFEPMDRRVSPKMTDVIFNRSATPYQLTWLFKAMANCLQIKSDIVLGHFKHPSKDINEVAASDKLVPNHSWISILIEGQWRMIDVISGNYTNDNYGFFNNGEDSDVHQSFYFLAKPFDIISTHIPIMVEQQHVVPPIDTMAAIALPPLYPAFRRYGLKYHRFNSSLTHLKDFDLAEFQIQVPADVEIQARFLQDEENIGNDSNDLVLSQAYWHKNRKFYVIRASLPLKTSMAFLGIYAGDKETSTNEYVLCSTIQLYHQGVSRPVRLVKRYPTIHTLNQDLAVQTPQLYRLTHGDAIQISIKQHPAFQIDSYNKHKTKTKLAIQSPSGKVHKLERIDDNGKIYGEWGLSLDLAEVGLWRGLVLTDDGMRWSVFCEWTCA